VTKPLIDSKLYQLEFLDSLRVTQLRKGDLIPPPFNREDVGFTIGTRVVLLEGQSIEGIPFGFWLKQIEIAKFFAEYGVTGMVKALSTDSKGIFGLVDAKVRENCATLSLNAAFRGGEATVSCP
jgi:hypothetical protein